MKAAFVGMTLTIFSLLTPSQCALAADPACQEIGGSVIFKNSLYGALSGGLLTGLIAIASKNSHYANQNIAAGGAIGASLGIGYGVFEVMNKRCIESNFSPTQKTGLSNMSPYFDGKNFAVKFQINI